MLELPFLTLYKKRSFLFNENLIIFIEEIINNDFFNKYDQIHSFL